MEGMHRPMCGQTVIDSLVVVEVQSLRTGNNLGRLLRVQSTIVTVTEGSYNSCPRESLAK